MASKKTRSGKKFVPILDIVDGNNFMNRAYFSAPKLTTSDGTHTGAAKAFINMINKLIKKRIDKRGECHLVIAFDSPSTNGFRRKRMAEFIKADKKSAESFLPEKYLKGYKGTRVKDPEKVAELGPQFDLVKKFLDARGIRHFQLDEYEADDIIGSLAFQVKCRVMIWSRDKDFAQLLCPTVRITQQAQGDCAERYYTYRNCCEFYGINPEMFVDYLALCGDSVDNIPGIPGIGDKIAIRLLNEYVDLEGIIDAAEEGKIKGKLSEKLKAPYNQKLLLLSRELAEICKSLDVDANYCNYLLKDISEHKSGLAKLSRKYEFTSHFTV
ncbi:MAG: 5'-3' exonuclease [Bacteroidales bacterium]